MKFIKKLIIGVFTIAGIFSLAGCNSSRATGSSSTSSKNITIGISLPDQTLPRWQRDGARLQSRFEKDGYKVILQYANNSTQTQASQIQNMGNQGAKYILVTPVDGTTLGPAVESAQSKGATIIAYDRIIMNTKAVSDYVTYNNENVGELQGSYIVQKLGLDKGAKGPFNIEMLAGDPTDNNASYFFAGALKELEPYFKSGALVSPSGTWTSSMTATQWQKVGISQYSTQTAQNTMGDRIHSFYTGGQKLDAVLSPNDTIALGVVNAIKAAGMNPSNTVITGQDCDTANVQMIVKGEQSMSVFKNSTNEADATAKVIEARIKGEKPATTTTTNNGSFNVPTVQLTPQIVTKDNVKSVLVDTGFISASDAGLS